MAEGDVKREGWGAEDLGEQSAYEDSTEMGRRLRRGDETAGDPDARDVAGRVRDEETSHGREDQDTLRESAEDFAAREPTDTGPRAVEGPPESHRRGTKPATEVVPAVDRELELRKLLLPYRPGEPRAAEEVANDYTAFVHLAPRSLLQESITATLRRSERRSELGALAERLAESYTEDDRGEAFARVLDASPGPPPAGLHQAMTPAELHVLVPLIAAQNPATIDRLAALIADDPGRAQALGREVLREILLSAAETLPEEKPGGAKGAGVMADIM